MMVASFRAPLDQSAEGAALLAFGGAHLTQGLEWARAAKSTLPTLIAGWVFVYIGARRSDRRLVDFLSYCNCGGTETWAVGHPQ